ncbi:MULTISPECIES: hypothetical protein [Enterobacterales]|uniref:Uncharacterized protein n=3 Tax=Enterobacterales TaxID=91347 RepID=A0A378B0V9_KLEPO|nr:MULTISPECIES: hypothetical protein [Enterobacterales]AYJ94776.1 hypothetical protein D9K64_17320 [Klebsiella pneumoniae]MBU9719563.1 hypothetical protein [Klebsiella pneumoniae subsp. ozaenae]VFS27584.1 Uncharacterised protein [Serratia liquefaciens]DAW19094.1 MAG TPA: hypothetical protein [Caudoviricetes sp.]ELH4207511.1 hypothetical protein [Serratia marcescens]
MGRRASRYRRGPATSAEMALLSEINQRLARMESSLDDVKSSAIRQGAIAGAITGSVSGGLVYTTIMLIKAKLGVG